MADVMLNGREPAGWELAALVHARQCERDRDLAQLAGVLTDTGPAHEGRPVTDLLLEFS